MDLSEYDFHDGYLVDVSHVGNKLILSMESAQVDSDEIQDCLPLSKHRTLKGKLHFEGVREIKVNDSILSGKMEKVGDEGDLFSIDFLENGIALTINWMFRTKVDANRERWCKYEIIAEKMYWENIPDLHNPSWVD